MASILFVAHHCSAVVDSGHGAKEGVELAHTPQSPNRRLGGNDYMAVGAELSADHSTDGASEAPGERLSGLGVQRLRDLLQTGKAMCLAGLAHS